MSICVKKCTLFLFGLFVVFCLHAQNRVIKGRVTGPDQSPLEGASVIVKGKKTGTTSGKDGSFTITLPAGSTVLVVSYTGMEETEVSVTDNTNIQVQLKYKSAGLDSVVVVGYGTQKKIDLTGSVAVVTSSQFENQPITSAGQVLAGKVAGLDLNQNSGLAGEGSNRITIRGVGTLNNSSPLIIIDGVVATDDNVPLFTAGGGGVPSKSTNPLDAINPDDIESISVLKDAASSAIYGSRAANGVILVTTKRGKRGAKAKVKYNGYVGYTKPTALPKMVNNTIDFMNLMNEAVVNSGQAPSFPDSVIQRYKKFGDTTNTDWMTELIPNKNTPISSHEVSVSGGSNNTNYFFSVGTLNQDAMVRTGNFKRYNLRLNLDAKIFDNFTIGTSTTFSRGEQKMPSNDILFVSVLDAMRATPVMPAFTKDGNLALLDNYSFFSVNSVQAGNALGRSFGNEVSSVTQSFLSSGYADWEIIKGLHLRGTMTVNINPFDQSTWTSNLTGYNWRYQELLAQGYTQAQVSGVLSTASLAITHSESKRINPYVQATYDRTFGKHRIGLLVGSSKETNYWSTTTTARRGFSSNETRIISAGDPSTNFSYGYGSQYALVSQFARANYSYNDKYLLELNARRDGSSRFGADNRYGIFPSVSAGWVLSQESFLQNVKALSLLKIRASWGRLGNQYASSDFPYLALISFGNNYNFNGTTVGGAAQSTFGNADLKWETTTTTDVGIDAGFFNSKLNVVADYYTKLSDGIIYNTPLPSVSGFSSVTTNLASVMNKGWELAANYTDVIGKVRIGLGGNISHNKNYIRYINKSSPESNDRVINGNYALLRGEPVDAIYGLKMIGIFQDSAEISKSPTQFSGTGPGDIKYADLSGPDGKPDGKIDGYDRTILGKESPSWVYGFYVNGGFKNFDLTLQFQGIGGAQTYGFFEYYSPTFQGSNIAEFWKDRWTPQNHSQTMPRLWNTSGPNTQLPNSFFVLDRSFLRLKNVTLQYDLSKAFRQTFISQFKIYVSGQNMLTFTNFKGFDPEKSYQLGRSGTPQVKIYTVGANVSF